MVSQLNTTQSLAFIVKSMGCLPAVELDFGHKDELLGRHHSRFQASRSFARA